MKRLCSSCGKEFRPYNTVPRQQYCSDIICQKTRRRLWHRAKLSSDESYRDNQADAQKAWRERNPGYWTRWRKRHPEYVERNQRMQRDRNYRRRQNLKVLNSGSPRLQRWTNQTNQNSIISGYYTITPVDSRGIAEMDEILVKIKAVTIGYSLSH